MFFGERWVGSCFSAFWGQVWTRQSRIAHVRFPSSVRSRLVFPHGEVIESFVACASFFEVIR